MGEYKFYCSSFGYSFLKELQTTKKLFIFILDDSGNMTL